MEDDKTESMSDKDAAMASKSSFESDDKDSEKSDKDKSEKKVPKRSLFSEKPLEAEKTESKPTGFWDKLLKGEVGEKKPADKEELADTDGSAEADPDDKQTKVASATEPGETESIDETATPEAITEQFGEIVMNRLDDVVVELNRPPETEIGVAEAIADAGFLESVGERLEEGLPPSEAIDEALIETIDTETDDIDAAQKDLDNPQNFENHNDLDPDDAEDDPLVPTTPIPPTPPSRPPKPPTPPTPPPPPSFPPTPPTRPTPPQVGPPPGSPPSPNAVPIPADADPMNEHYYRRRNSGRVILAGLLGYAVGRRGGRVRTEKRLEPAIEKQAEQIDKLKYQLSESEEAVRQAAATKVLETAGSLPVVAKKSETVKAGNHDEESLKVAESKVDKLPVMSAKQELDLIEQQEKLYAADLLEKTKEERDLPILERQVFAPGESLADSLIGYEEKRALVTERRPLQEVIRENRKDVKTMNITELLEIADNIYLESTSLRQLYERRRVDAINLRRVVTEYIQGGEGYKSILRKSLEAVELQRELSNETKGESSQVGTNVSSGSTYNAGAGYTSGYKQPDQPSLAGSLVDEMNSSLGVGHSQNKADESFLEVSQGAAIIIGIAIGVILMVAVFFLNF